jgi:taurine dioxygenase
VRSLHVEDLPGQKSFGAVVIGLTEEMLADAQTRQDLNELWIDKGVIVFRGMAGIGTHIRLSEVFGEPEEHPLLRGVDQPREHKLIIDLVFDSSIGDLYEVDGELRGSWLPWHSDLIYLDKINHGGILRPVVVPERGGETGFIDQIAAYDALPPELKREIEGLSVVYKHAIDSSLAKFGKRPERCLRLHPYQVRTAQHPAVQHRVIHPMVYTQKETGRKVLYVSPWFAEGIEGKENAEGDALLQQVIERLIQPQRAYFHRWQEGDMVLWDNWRVLHCAPGVPVGCHRHMRRTTITGDYALGRKENPEAVFPDELRAGV